ncbi:hypothetical protein SCUCBS95973_004773 [Sporothrix curviconia]|uniref:Protein kinase domain-containing protein n=1 Tax=Sporothrix curviconia TaxID=1260050 RepID=A0ABP0BRE5_9PEZI
MNNIDNRPASEQDYEYGEDILALTELNGGNEHNADVMLLFNNVEIYVFVEAPLPPPTADSPDSPVSLNDSVEQRLVDLINRATMGDPDDDDNELTMAILDILQPAGEKAFRSVDPRKKAEGADGGPEMMLLHHLLHVPRYFFYFKRDAPDDEPKVVPMPEEEVEKYLSDLAVGLMHSEAMNTPISFADCRELPRYSTRDLHVVEEFADSGYATLMRPVGSTSSGDDMLCKATSEPCAPKWTSLQREMAILSALHKNEYETPTGPVRTPRLMGLVVDTDLDDDTFNVVGFVRQWLPGESLDYVLRRASDGPSADDKRRWSAQIRQSVDALHSLGLVWGDGKTGNVVVGMEDKDDDNGDLFGDAWLIDFGGGLTQGWIDQDKENTAEGDRQAVKKILEALRV